MSAIEDPFKRKGVRGEASPLHHLSGRRTLHSSLLTRLMCQVSIKMKKREEGGHFDGKDGELRHSGCTPIPRNSKILEKRKRFFFFFHMWEGRFWRNRTDL